jgi:hypothetical protein
MLLTSSLTGANILLGLCSQTHSVCVLALMWETKYLSHTYKKVGKIVKNKVQFTLQQATKGPEGE